MPDIKYCSFCGSILNHMKKSKGNKILICKCGLRFHYRDGKVYKTIGNRGNVNYITA
jgi:hypothetical protein